MPAQTFMGSSHHMLCVNKLVTKNYKGTFRIGMVRLRDAFVIRFETQDWRPFDSYVCALPVFLYPKEIA
ncbi:hypothetical protein A256_18111 [Pseudomonas syringae pv. actinidiae ICMP 19103]|nr:hypothetical protein PSYAC_29316 [Pseudomonas syringae pv. actinidiae str. M302091]EPM50574.1 hypothetical protein A256_18111 [Pseudomonas syringae pv. actinidiae ICMP 19103]EPM90661.1 hypothetical protein A260_00015 [Pseudomonas syringae pv. actinidiae ICMP 19068]EPM94167.1 hypothetical protein A258_21933 [Pseudomonas syringae pv. actinidiae ICMP 19104]EPM99935.1 hypothetical protein A253_26950 [Pseudomonas syringae pv. actinidiae ICMP 19102]EPN08669.1 hypothetical protein A252_21715 [Pseu